MGISTLKIEFQRQIRDHFQGIVGEEKKVHLLKRDLFIGKNFCGHISSNHFRRIMSTHGIGLYFSLNLDTMENNENIF